MAFNPFLMETDYAQPPNPMYTAAAPMDTSQSSNPFLSFGAPQPVQAAPAPVYLEEQASYAPAMGGGGDNPFLSYADTSAPAAASNPFADYAPSCGANAYFSSTADMSYAHQTYMPEAAVPEAAAQQLIDTSEGLNASTQNLLDSVTGVLEATSDSLLHRLRVNAPSPTPEIPSPRSPSPDLMGDLMGDMTMAPPPAPPSSANPLAPSPHNLDNIMGLFNDSKPVVSALPPTTSATLDLMGLYNSVPVATTPAPAPPPPPPTEPPPSVPTQALVDWTIEPATPLLKERQESQDQKKKEVKVASPQMLSPDQQPPPIQEVSSLPEKPPPPRPPSPIKQSVSPAHSPPSRPPPPPAAVNKSPEKHENKPMPSRPPPPAPIRASPQPPAPPPPPQVVAPVHPVQAPAPIHAFSAPPPPVQAYAPVAPIQAAAPIQAFSAPPPLVQVYAPVAPIQAAAPIQAFSAPAQPPPPVSAVSFSMGGPVTSFTSSGVKSTTADVFDAFDAKFEKLAEAETGKTSGDAFGPPTIITSAWGNDGDSFGGSEIGFGNSTGFDPFLSLTEPPPVPQSTPAKQRREGGGTEGSDFDEDDKEMTINIRPHNKDLTLSIAPCLAPPLKSPAMSTGSAYSEENNTAYIPFLSQSTAPMIDNTYATARKQGVVRSDSAESPTTPLYEEDTSQPLEEFPRTTYITEGWEMQMRYPNKKVTFGGNRSWRGVFVRIELQGDVPILKIYGKKGDKEALQEIPLQSSYSVSDISAQQFDTYGKIFTIKVQFVYYKERPGVRPGQIGKASKLSSKLSAFAAYAITGDTSGVKEFGSDLKKLGLPLEHAPQVSQLVKLGSQSYDEMKQFSVSIEEALFKLPAHRDRALNYKTEEIQVTTVDEYFVEQDVFGVVTRQIARVRVMFLSFLNGLAEIEMGVNDLRRQGKEVVGRHDICPVPTEEWIRMEDIQFSNIVDLTEFNETQTIKFKPPDASYLELMRFRVRPPRHRELPLQVKTTFTTTGQRIEIRSDILVPGYTSRKLGQIPCEDVMVRFPIPETWIYMFRVEKHFRYGSVKSAHRRSGKVKGIERVLGALDVVEPSLMETTSGQAKYEHHHRAIVWRIPRLPKEGQGAYTTHSFFCHITLQPHEKIPDSLTKVAYVDFTMPHTCVSHTVCRSISVPTSEEPPEKCCRYLSRHEYIVEIEHKEGITPASYSAAATVVKEEEVEEVAAVRGEFEEQKYDSDFSDE